MDYYSHYKDPRKREEGKKGEETYLKKPWLKMSLTWGKKQIQIQEAHRCPNKKNLKRLTQRHIEIKLSNIKEGILIAAREQL